MLRTRWVRMVAVACLAFTALGGCDDDGGAAAPEKATTSGAAEAAPGPQTEASGSPVRESGSDSGPGTPAADPSAGAAGPAGASTDPAPTGGEAPPAEAPEPPAGAGPSSATPADPRPGSAGTSASPAKPSKPEPAFVRSREVRILAGEGDDNPFEPRLTRVFQGTLIRWVNLDSVPRSVQATSGEFKSPMIPPGGFFDYQADELGLFEYFDGTRPTAMGAIQVV